MWEKCEKCKKKFTVSFNKRNAAKYCSRSCQVSCQDRSKRKKVKIVLCAICGKEFCQKRINQILCSGECRFIFTSGKLVGENNGRYIHGKANNGYPIGWTKSYKKQIRKRDGEKCLECGMTKERHEGNLHVHHINYIKEDLSENNLITLCKFCHGSKHGNLKKRKKWQRLLSNLLKEKK